MDVFAGMDRATGAHVRAIGDARRFGSRWLTVAQVGWVLLALVVVAIPIGGIPLVVVQLGSPCADAPTCSDTGQLTPDGVRLLQNLGLPPNLYATLMVTIPAVAAAVWISASALVVRRRPSDPVALLTGYFLLAGSVGVADGPLRDAVAASHPAWALTIAIVHALAGIALGFFLALFPDGRWVPGWSRWLPLGWAAYVLPHVVLPGSDAFLLPVILALAVASAWAQTWRYRRGSDVVQRQQIKWAVFGSSAALGGWFAVQALGNTVFAEQLRSGTSWSLLLNAVIWLPVPVSICVAVLHYRLWDVEPIVHRTLVYGALTVAVAGLYVLLVGYFSLLLRVNDSPLAGLLATGVVASLFQPLRVRLQRGVSRLLYGQRDEPYAVLSRLGQRLESLVAPDAVLPTIVQSVAEALKFPYVAIGLGTGAASEIAAAHGRPVEGLGRWLLVYQTETVGELLVAPRTPGEGFSVSDRRLLDDLARQVGVAAHGVRLTRDLQRLAADLQQAREHLVAGREEERRRLRRDLHDGIGPTLASLVQRLDAASRLVPRDPQAAVAVLVDLKTQTRTTVAEIRQLVYALRPPALDELGLVSAIREHAAQHLEPTGLRVVVEVPSPFPPLPAAVEVAAYRIVLEALTNVARHASAHACSVRLVPGQDLVIEVMDDGCGFEHGARAGVGLSSMRERAAELGGECVVERAPTGGTRVWARLPRSAQCQEG